MSEGRIARLTSEEAHRAAREVGVPEYMADLSIFQVLLRHPKLARRFNALLAQLLFENSLDSRLRELVIMRIGWATVSEYEWTQHWAVATGLGVPEDDLLGVRDWSEHEGFSEADRAVLAATDEVLREGAVSAVTWARLEEHVGREIELLELVTAIGAWAMVSSMLRSLEIPLEDGVASWPPDGTRPPKATP